MATETEHALHTQQRIQHLKNKISKTTILIGKEDTTRNHIVDKFLKNSMHAQGTNSNLFQQAKASFEKSSARISLYKKKLRSYTGKLHMLEKQLDSTVLELEKNMAKPEPQTELECDEQHQNENGVMADQCLKEIKLTTDFKFPAVDSSEREDASLVVSQCSAKYTYEELQEEICALRHESQVLWFQLREVWGGFSDETERLWGSLKEVTQQRNNLEAQVFELAQRHISIVDEMRRVLDDIEVEREVDTRAELKDSLERCLVRLEQLEENAEKSKPEKVTKTMVILGLLEPIIFLFKLMLLLIIHAICISISLFSKSED